MGIEIKNILQNLNLSFLKPRQGQVDRIGMVGIRFSAKKIFLAYVIGETKEDLKVLCMIEKPASTWEERTAALTEMVQEYTLENQLCSIVLTPQEYRLIMIDKPEADVEDLEFEVANLIQDYISYKTEDASIDYFNLPFSRSGDGKQVMFAVATKLSLMQSVIDCVTTAGLKIEAIDIPEFSYRNLNCLEVSTVKGYMIVNIGNLGATLYTYNNTDLIMARRVDFDLSKFGVDKDVYLKPDVEDEVLDGFTIQLQRSIDYCNSVFRQAPIEKLIFFSCETNVDVVSVYLSQQLGIKSSVFDLPSFIGMPDGYKEQNYKQYYAAIGATLRKYNFFQEAKAEIKVDTKNAAS